MKQIPKFIASILLSGIVIFASCKKETVTTPSVQVVDTFRTSRPQINAQLIPVGFLSQPRIGMAVASAGNKLFFAGGNSGNTAKSVTAKVDIYDIGTDTWSSAELSKARSYMTAAVLGARVFFAGGHDQTGNASSRVDVYNVQTNAWTTTELSQGRSSMAGGTVGTKVFFAGGFAGPGGTPAIVDIYDITSNRWTTHSLTGRSADAVGIATTVLGNKIYFGGGFGDFPGWDHGEYSKTINIYDALTDTWSTSTLSKDKGGMAAIAVGSKIYWAGGKNTNQPPNDLYYDEVEIKDVSTGTTSFGRLFQPNAGFPIGFDAVLKNDKIVFFTGSGAIKNKFDIYDTTTRTWYIGALPKNVESTSIISLEIASMISVNNVIYVAGGKLNGVLSIQLWKLEF